MLIRAKFLKEVGDKLEADESLTYLNSIIAARLKQVIGQEASKISLLPIVMLDKLKEKFEGKPITEGFIENFSEIVTNICITKDRQKFKEYCHQMINLCVENGLPFNDGAARNVQIFWTNMGLEKGSDSLGLLQEGSYQKFVSDGGSLAFGAVWDIIPLLVRASSQIESGTIIEQYSKECAVSRNNCTSSKPNEKDIAFKIPLFRVLSEVWAERVQVEHLREIKIEFGQNIEGRKEERIGIRSENTMFQSELPILLAKAAKYNVDLERFNAISQQICEIEGQTEKDDTLIKLKKSGGILESELSKPEIESKRGKARIELRESVTHSVKTKGSIQPEGTLIFEDATQTDGKLHVNISELQKFVEQATTAKGEMLTVKETMQALQRGGTLGEYKKDSLSPLAEIVTVSTIDRASHQPIITSPAIIKSLTQ